jgi:hypothetical protein
VDEEIESVKVEPKEVKPSIPTVKPPISFPTLPEHVEVLMTLKSVTILY